ncbi:MAG: hypothetical protein RBR16_03085 [Syntrophus sp. (in: bacteria)]|nr:hypothetical protein [Syntrophus sp. (in: bacteria)]
MEGEASDACGWQRCYGQNCWKRLFSGLSVTSFISELPFEQLPFLLKSNYDASFFPDFILLHATIGLGPF